MTSQCYLSRSPNLFDVHSWTSESPTTSHPILSHGLSCFPDVRPLLCGLPTWIFSASVSRLSGLVLYGNDASHCSKRQMQKARKQPYPLQKLV